MFTIRKYEAQYQNRLLQFLEICLPQSDRKFEPDGRHKMYRNVPGYFEHFWCLFDGEDMIGTAALKKLDSGRCELKALYLLEKYHKKGLGRRLLNTVLQKARQDGYGEIYLDTLSSSRRAVCLYEKAGFERTERYNENYTADIFMVLKLSEAGGFLG